jgi:hypothetical protein
VTVSPTPTAPAVTITAAACSAAGSMNVTIMIQEILMRLHLPTVGGTGVITGGAVGHHIL